MPHQSYTRSPQYPDERNKLHSFPPGKCPLTDLPYEIRSIILAELSENPYHVHALAKTCFQFYVIYRDEKKARIKYASQVMEKLIGFSSPSLVRLCLLSLACKRFNPDLPRPGCFHLDRRLEPLRETPLLQEYHRRNWVFSLSDYRLVKSAVFEDEVRALHRDVMIAREKGYTHSLGYPAIHLPKSMSMLSWLRARTRTTPPSVPLTVGEFVIYVVLRLIVSFRATAMPLCDEDYVLEKWEPKREECAKILNEDPTDALN
ncbi:hypothetical protein F5Y01DRAFT_311828 [Xylaria sp. FL0043]|nr:hypothetical protein F5Y01DRAFT_311828 [Xylaria sp. FL0043]